MYIQVDRLSALRGLWNRNADFSMLWGYDWIMSWTVPEDVINVNSNECNNSNQNDTIIPFLSEFTRVLDNIYST